VDFTQQLKNDSGVVILANDEWHFVSAHESSGSTPGSQIARNKANQMVRLVVVCRAGLTARRCKSSSQRDGREVIAKRKGEITLAARRGLKKRGAKTRADEQEPDKRPTVAGERATDCEAHIHQAHWW
jgi:hypothetical protein